MDYCVYALSDETGIRYIGKTKTSHTTERLRNHLKDRSKCHRVSWLVSLRNQNKSPTLTILLDGLSEIEALQTEKHLIAEYRKLGSNLVNQTLGGDGVSGYCHTEETRKRMSLSHMGHPTSEETRRKISIANQKRQRRKFGPHTLNTRKKISEANILKRGKSVRQKDPDGNEIRQWRAIQEAAKTLNISASHIIACCKGKRKFVNGFRWEYVGC